jgi:hypothetical protein
MNTPDHSAACLLTDLFGRDLIDQRRPLSVQGHHQFRESYALLSRTHDELDELVGEIDAAEFEGKGSRP